MDMVEMTKKGDRTGSDLAEDVKVVLASDKNGMIKIRNELIGGTAQVKQRKRPD